MQAVAGLQPGGLHIHCDFQAGLKHFIILPQPPVQHGLRILITISGTCLILPMTVIHKNMLIFRTDFTKPLQMHLSSYHHINHSFKYFYIPKKMIDAPSLKLPLMPDQKHSLIWYLFFQLLEYKMSLTDSYTEHLDSS